MQTPFVQNQIGSRAGQVTIGKLALFRICQISFPLPPLPPQKVFTGQMAEIRKLQVEQDASLEGLEALFQSMLHRAFQGEL
jgi:restriction endonuclease S subunit